MVVREHPQKEQENRREAKKRGGPVIHEALGPKNIRDESIIGKIHVRFSKSHAVCKKNMQFGVFVLAPCEKRLNI